MIQDENKNLSLYIKKCAPILDHNLELFEIYEGNLLKYLLQDLQAQLNQRAFDQIKHRVSPINVMRRLISKLSKIYAKPPQRTIVNGTDADQALLDWYVTTMDVNVVMGLANEYFNLFKNTLVEPFLYNGLPHLRVNPSDRFLAYSNDRIQPTNPTKILKYLGKHKYENGEDSDAWLVYSDDFIYVIDDDGDIITGYSDEIDQLEMINPVSKIPMIYINRSRHDVIPTIDSDTLKMTKLLPVLLSDLNYAVMFQSFSIIYGINIDSENLKMAPNAFWSFKSDPTTNTPPEIGTIKPDVDSDKVLDLIKAQMSMWFQSRNVKPGSLGDLNIENAASGISKAIDEMDTSEDRSNQVPYFIDAEKRLWDLIIKNMHPNFIKDPKFPKRNLFSPGCSVAVTFPEQKPFTSRGDILDQVIKELSTGLTTRTLALKKLNPDMSDFEIEQLISEIERERTISISDDLNEDSKNDSTGGGQKGENGPSDSANGE